MLRYLTGLLHQLICLWVPLEIFSRGCGQSDKVIKTRRENPIATALGWKRPSLGVPDFLLLENARK